MRRVCLFAFLVLFQLSRPSAAADQNSPVPKNESDKLNAVSKRLQEGYKQLKAGMTVDQLTKLLGPVTTINIPGDPTIKHCDQELRWIDRSTVKVTLQGGKLSAVFAEVSPTLVFQNVSQATVLKLKPGMTEKEVVAVLGGGYASQDGKDGSKVLTWTARVSLAVQLYQGRFGTAKELESSSFSLK
jgi:hypothetical protein